MDTILADDMDAATAAAASAEVAGVKSMKATVEKSFLEPQRSGGRGAGSGRGLQPDGWKLVLGFEAQGLRVAARCGKKLPKTQSWRFVPLIFSALGRVPERLRRDGIAGEEQIAIAQRVWARLFSHWAEWRDVLRKAIDAYDTSQGAVGR